MEHSFALGDIVKPTSGHNKNRTFLVVAIDKKNYIAIIDGRSRKKDNPKLKNPKHVEFIDHSDELLKKFNTPTVTDTEIYNQLKKFIKEWYV